MQYFDLTSFVLFFQQDRWATSPNQTALLLWWERRLAHADAQTSMLIYDWFVCARATKKPVSGPIILTQVEKMSADNSTPFTSSQGWLRRFKERHGIREVKINGEASSADVVTATEFLPTYREIAADYNDDQIYNCNESGLYYRNMPDKMLTQENELDESVGFKALKDQVTLLLTCKQSGSHQMKPLLIGMYGKPRCFHHINTEKLPITNRHSTQLNSKCVYCHHQIT